jgi:inhibitor of cysteine peptidase
MLKPVALVIAALAPAAAAAQESARETLRLKSGASAAIVMKENPSTGYVWRLDEAGSAGLEAVAIEDNGHTRGAARPGAPGTHRWTVRALQPGRALIGFDHQRPWEPAPIETRRVEVIISAGRH